MMSRRLTLLLTAAASVSRCCPVPTRRIACSSNSTGADHGRRLETHFQKLMATAKRGDEPPCQVGNSRAAEVAGVLAGENP
jgi:hypothetical protein